MLYVFQTYRLSEHLKQLSGLFFVGEQGGIAAEGYDFLASLSLSVPLAHASGRGSGIFCFGVRGRLVSLPFSVSISSLLYLRTQ